MSGLLVHTQYGIPCSNQRRPTQINIWASTLSLLWRGSDVPVQMCRLTRAGISLHPGSVLAQKANLTSFMRTAKALASLHIWVSLEPSSLNQNLMCWLKRHFYMRRPWRVCTFDWSSLSLRHSSKILYGSNGDLMLFCVSSEGCTIAQAYLSLRHVAVPKAASNGELCILFTPAAKTLVSLHICAGIVTGQCDKYQNLMHLQRRLWRASFAQARLSLVTLPLSHMLAQMAI